MGRKVLYITAQTPWGKGETFTMGTLLELKRQGVGLLIIPRSPAREVYHKEASDLLENAHWLPLMNVRMLAACLGALFTETSFWRAVGRVVRDSRTPLILAKNLAVVPKASLIARQIRRQDIGHIHAEWGSTTSTMGYLVSQMTGIDWSFTLHRWDIDEDNMLKEKARTARFARCISRRGRDELVRIIGRGYEDKVHVIRLGVTTPATAAGGARISDPIMMVVPANLVEKKGHEYLVRALSIVAKQSAARFQCVFFGEGPLRPALQRCVREVELTESIKMPGTIPHERLMELYGSGAVDIVVLPSITASNGEREGIPVALMEAMSFGIPVVSTPTGGIAELIVEGAGVMVEEKNVEQLADAIAALVDDGDLRQRIGIGGRDRVSREFNSAANTAQLIELMKCGCPGRRPAGRGQDE